MPLGVYAGFSFEFEYEAAAAQAPVPFHAPLRTPQQPAGNLTTRVTVPPGVGPGSTLTVNVPGRGIHHVTVPQGVYAGHQFEFRVQ